MQKFTLFCIVTVVKFNSFYEYLYFRFSVQTINVSKSQTKLTAEFRHSSTEHKSFHECEQKTGRKYIRGERRLKTRAQLHLPMLISIKNQQK